MKRVVRFFATITACFVFTSCVGVTATITFDRGGSGRLVATYRISAMVQSIGKLEANAGRLPFPVAREDFDRSVARTPGLRLIKYDRKDGADDSTIDVEVAFDTPAALVSFLDPDGVRASYNESGGVRELSLLVATAHPGMDPDVASFIDAVFEGYTIDFTVKTPTKIVSALPGTVDGVGTSARYTAPMPQLLKSATDVQWNVRW